MRVVVGQLLTKSRLAVLVEMALGSLVVAFVTLVMLDFGIPLAVISCLLTWLIGCRLSLANC